MTLSFPNSTQRSGTSIAERNYQAKKKDIAAYLSNHIQPNHSTTVTLSDASGKTVIINCNNSDPIELLDLAITYLTP